MIKIDLKQLAKELVNESAFFINDYEITFYDKEGYPELIDDHLNNLLDDDQLLEEVELQQLHIDIIPFISLEIYNRAKSFVENMDKDDRETLTDNIKEYDTYQEDQND